MSNTIYTINKDEFFEQVLYKNLDGSVKDLTGHTSLIRVTKYYGSANTISINGTIELPATSGIVRYNAPFTIWNNVDAGAYVYSRHLYDNLDKVVDVVSGDLILIPAV